MTPKAWFKGHQVSVSRSAVTVLILGCSSAMMETTKMGTDAQACAKSRRIGSALVGQLLQKINVTLRNSILLELK